MSTTTRSPAGRWRLDRRMVVRGAGIALGLPWLEAMIPPGRAARAATAPQKRFISWFRPGGAVKDAWQPKGTETDFTLSPTLAPLQPFRDKIVVLEGVDYKVGSVSTGNNHYRGLAAFLTGERLPPGTFSQPGGSPTGWAQGPSIDQVIGQRIGANTKLKTLNLAVRHDGPQGAHPIRETVYEAADRPVTAIVDPVAAWGRVFGDFAAAAAAGGSAAAEAALRLAKARDKSIIDAVRAEYAAVMKKVGAADRARLEAHVSRFREMEQNLDRVVAPASASCMAPEQPLPGTKYSSLLVPAHGKAMMDLLVMALACNLTHVATLQWVDPFSRNAFEYLELGKSHHHVFQHDGGYQPVQLAVIEKFYVEQFAYLLKRLSEIKEGDATLLDNAIVLNGSELSHAGAHSLSNIPFVLAGRLAGALRPGRYLKFSGVSSQNLLVSIQNAFGIPDQTFGYKATVTGALAGLMA